MNDKTMLPPNATKLEQSIVAAFLNQLSQKEIFIGNLFNADNCSELFLVYLAQFLSVDFQLYHQLLDKQKRIMIKQSIETHRKKGTTEALVDALSHLKYQFKVREWYEQKYARAHTFLLEIDLKNNQDSQQIDLDEINAIVKKNKNLQSSYALKLNRQLQMAIYICGSISSKHTFVFYGG
ncbi:phage tail protein I [Thiotrichales bacterium 19S3-7]|nr:phage tail protein I [Thiotrichales bacterium 19S3-7]MCF6801279.1 phage tail protein I [Thiotrichales bacterium 19S3-11]